MADQAYETPAPVAYDAHEREVLAVIAQRDAAYEVADALAAKVAAGRWIGEHTSENNPWQNALDLPDLAAKPDADVQEYRNARDRDAFMGLSDPDDEEDDRG